MSNYNDNIDIIMTALTEMSMHMDDGHYSEIKPKIATASYYLGELAMICQDLEKSSNDVRYDKLLKAYSELQYDNLTLKSALSKAHTAETWHRKMREQDNLDRETINSSVKHGRKIMKVIGKHK